MAEYRKIEYRIGKDGKITEKVLNGSGEGCQETTKGIEEALGKVESQEFLPEYYQGDNYSYTDDTQSLTQN